jgi:hypothetical protein
MTLAGGQQISVLSYQPSMCSYSLVAILNEASLAEAEVTCTER